MPSVIHGAKSCDFFIPQVLTDLALRVKDKSAKLSDKISMEILKKADEKMCGCPVAVFANQAEAKGWLENTGVVQQ